MRAADIGVDDPDRIRDALTALARTVLKRRRDMMADRCPGYARRQRQRARSLAGVDDVTITLEWQAAADGTIDALKERHDRHC